MDFRYWSIIDYINSWMDLRASLQLVGTTLWECRSFCLGSYFASMRRDSHDMSAMVILHSTLQQAKQSMRFSPWDLPLAN